MDVMKYAQLRPLADSWREIRKRRWKAMSEFNALMCGTATKNITAENLREYDDKLHRFIDLLLEESEAACAMAEELES